MLDRIQRLLRHRWHDHATLRRALPPAALERLTQRVQASEQRHSGEIRVYIEAGLPSSYLWRRQPLRQVVRERALRLFGKLRVWDTEHNNGVLIYLLLADRSIEIVADRGLARSVTEAEWHRVMRPLREALRAGDFEGGLVRAVDEVAALLKDRFVHAEGEAAHDVDELPDRPVVL